MRARGVKLGTPANLTAAARLKGARNSGLARTELARKETTDIAEIAARMTAEGATAGQIARHLNAEEEPTRGGSLFNPETGRGGWSAIQVKRILDRARS